MSDECHSCEGFGLAVLAWQQCMARWKQRWDEMGEGRWQILEFTWYRLLVEYLISLNWYKQLEKKVPKHGGSVEGSTQL